MPKPSETQRAERDEAYAPLEAPDVLPVLSLAAFTMALGARPLVRLLAPSTLSTRWLVLLPVLAALAASALGTLLALWGQSRARRRGLARMALLLNAIVVVLTALTIAGMFYIYGR